MRDDPTATDDPRAAAARGLVAACAVTARSSMTRDEAARALGGFGFAFSSGITITNPHAACRAASDLGWPVGLLLVTADGVGADAGRQVPPALHLESVAAVRDAFTRLVEAAGGPSFDLAVAVVPHAAEAVTLDLSLRYGTDGAPVLQLIGPAGGAATGAVPPTSGEAARLLEASGAAASAEAELHRLARLALAVPELSSVHLSPVLAAPSGEVTVLDARLDIDLDALLEGS